MYLLALLGSNSVHTLELVLVWMDVQLGILIVQTPVLCALYYVLCFLPSAL